MPRNKSKNQGDLLSQLIIVRVTQKVFDKLENLQKKSNCQSIGEVARKILSRENILMLHRNISMNGPMEELALIRKELKSIGVKINQQTRNYNAVKEDHKKAFYYLKTADLYKQVGDKVDTLLMIVQKLALKWLQES